MSRFDQPTPGSLADRQVEADPESVARTIALRRLDFAPRTRANLAATFAERGVPDDVATKVLDRFEEVGLIDDAAYAQLLLSSRSGSRGLSGPALRAEFKRRGVPDSITDQVLSEIDPEAVFSDACAIVRSKWKSSAQLDDASRTRRLTAALQRRGYSFGVISRAIREVSEEIASPD